MGSTGPGAPRVTEVCDMRILQLAPLWERVPPPAYGGTETVVANLTEELIRRGHEVVLWASGDSATSAELRCSYYRSLRTAADLSDPAPHTWLHVARALEDAAEFDLLHNHAGELPMALARLLPTPMLTTMHGVITMDTYPIWVRYQGYYNTVSRNQARRMPLPWGPRFAGSVHHGIDVETFPFQAEKEDFLLFLSRLAPEKGPHLAVELARKTGRRLVLAGKVDDQDRGYFEAAVRPRIDGRQVQFVGEADATLKRELYRKAAALVLPLQWEEPFGLVMVEAMACGTPVLAFRRGAAPELVVEGETGFLGDTVADLAAAVDRLETLDPARCRAHVAAHFTVGRMVDAYEAIYAWMLSDQQETPPPEGHRVRPAA